MNPNVDETLAADLATYAADYFEAHGCYRVEDAVRAVLPSFAAGKTDPPNPDEIGRAYSLAMKRLGVRPRDGYELHPDGTRRESDATVVRGIASRLGLK